MRRGTLKTWVARSIAGAALVGAATIALRTASAGGYELTGQPAPEIRLTEGLNGASASTTLASLRGKVVCLKFWLTHCPICRGTLPEFQAIHDTYLAQGVTCLGVVIDSAAGVAPYLREAGWTFAVGCDPNQASSNLYGVHHFPGDYLIGSDGIVKASNGFPRGAIEQEIQRTRGASDDPRKNVEELGEVPAVLAGAKDAAAKNDFGGVLRIVEAHLDPAKESADVVAAAKRIREVCRARWNRRVQRIRARWDGGDPRGAYADAVRFSDDFKGTTLHEATVKWVKDLEAALAVTPGR